MGGMAMALVIGGLLLGALANVPPIHLPGIGVVRNWQLVFMIVGLPGLLVAALIALTVPSPARRIVTRPKGYPLREVFACLVSNRALHAPLLLGMLCNSIMNFGAAAWLPAFYERTYGWSPAKAGPLIGTFLLFGSLTGIFLGARFAEWLGKKHDDANLRVLFLANLCCAPFLIMAPLMPNPWLALCSNALGSIIITMGGAGYNSALQISTPVQMRAQINALYLFTIGGLGGAFGPLLIALLTDFVAGADNYLRYVLFGFRLVLAPLDAFLIWLAIKPYAKAVRQRIEAGD
jgi:MFS family permease